MQPGLDHPLAPETDPLLEVSGQDDDRAPRADTCTQCSAGSYHQTASNLCLLCPPGTVSTFPGAEVVIRVPNGLHPFPRQDAVRPRQQQHHFVCGPPVVHTLPGRHLSWQPSLSPRLHPVFPSPRTLSLHHQPLAWLYRLLLRAGNHQLCQPAGFCGSHSDDSARIHIIVGSEVSQICSKHRVDLSAHLGETGVARNDMVSRSIHRPVTSTVSHPSPA